MSQLGENPHSSASYFDFRASDSQMIAEEALEAGLTVEDVAGWIE
jgi:hypothetical protein